MSNNGNSNGGGGFIPTPWPAPNIIAPSAPPGSVLGGAQPAPSQVGLPFTKVNSTNDPRVLYEDSQIAIIFAGDFPANSGMGRSKSRKTLQDAMASQIDPGLQTGVGAGSRGDLVKVYLAELLARPVNLQTVPVPMQVGRPVHSPSALQPRPPRIASSGAYKGQVIPDFPHTCTRCGGKMYQGMFESIHNTPDGMCPTEAQKPRRR